MSRRTALAMLAGLGTTGCLQLGFIAANLPARLGDYKRRADIAYGDDRRQKLDVYTPDRVAANAPVIVFWHGGRWTSGDKSQYRFVGAALASLGYIAVLPNYRHYPQVKMPGFMADAARAAVWTYREGVRPANARRIFFMGHSAGAHIAALLTLDTRYLAAAGELNYPIAGFIGLSGAYDFLPLTEDDTRDMFGPPPLYPESQPINFARSDAPPMLLVHGEEDRTVYPKNSRNLATALQAKGAKVTLRLYPKLKHGDTVAALSKPARGRAPILQDIQEFVG